jgi:hypothetical protein
MDGNPRFCVGLAFQVCYCERIYNDEGNDLL